MERGALSDQDVIRSLAPFKLLAIDHSTRSDATRSMLLRWKVEVLPTMIFLDAEGEEVGRLEGRGAAPEIIEFARKAARATER